jgi:alkylation response protein AidB-like acyl-CoA dehydrogenase
VSSPVEALFAAPPEVADHPAVRAAARIAAELLEPHAAAADDARRGVEAADLERIAEAGLMSVLVPAELGGHGAGPRVDAEVVELLSAGCAATWFVLTQHTLASALVSGPLRVPPGGAEIGPAALRYRDTVGPANDRTGIAIAHIRRPGPPAIRASPDGRGGCYRLHGRADWCTGWGLIDLVLIAARTAAGDLLFALLPATEQPGLTASTPLPLAVMGGTHTVSLELDGLPVAAEDVLLTVRADSWLAADRQRTANATPASLGLLRRALVELDRLGAARAEPAATRVAAALAERAARLRGEAYRLITEVPAGERLAERTALRGRLAELTVRATQALVTARSGGALLMTSPEQRWAREASFHLIQAQTADVRAAQLAAFDTP